MAYESFKLGQVEERFELVLVQTGDAYGQIPPIEPSDLLMGTLRRGRPLVVGQTSEKARSEFIVAQVLLEMRDIVHDSVVVFSGIKFDVDRKEGLFGYCDFLISRDAIVDEIKAPVLLLTEAKKEDLSSGIPQCIAEMVAAQRFNDRKKKPIETVYGSVTDGTRWRFLSLVDKTVSLDLREYSIAELPQILGILVYMVS
ncbi:MAG: hypothetical protein H7145_01235 [Akkermansiaceae bacterium]|nr:hypothetical protein [Armatimonadota bacterium]